MQKIGFTCGTFDLCHYGHIIMLAECKSQCDYLVVAVQEDPTVDRSYKNMPIQTLGERLGVVKAVRYVDVVLPYNTEDELYQILQSIKIDVRFVGEDWYGKKITGDDLGIPIIFNSRTHLYSTTELRERIKNGM